MGAFIIFGGCNISATIIFLSVVDSFHFFDTYFDNQLYRDLKNEFDEIYNIEHNNIIAVDHSICTIKIHNSILFSDLVNSEIVTVNYAGNIKNKIDIEFDDFRSNLNQKLENIYSNKEQSNGLLDFYLDKFKNLLHTKNSVKKYEFLKNQICHFIEEIESLKRSSNWVKKTEYMSFFINEKSCYNESHLTKLYELLSEGNTIFIISSLEDFVNGFNNKPIKDGVCWNVKGKNHSISKPSLFYFIDSLIKIDLIQAQSISTIINSIRYVFRDEYGKSLINLKQSFTNYQNSKKVEKQDEIDKVILDFEELAK